MAKFTDNTSNINLLWAKLCIEELVRHGVTDFCIAPGSRSTPLTLMAAAHKEIQIHLHFDERGLGFLALGLSLASLKSVAIITTSGTAVANLYPAIIEAKQSNLNLIVLSADRPPELLDCGANQAIDQHRIFSHYPLFFAQIPTPTLAISPSFLLTTLHQGLQLQQQQCGPIHFNFSFAAPFYPQDDASNYHPYLAPLQHWLNDTKPFTQRPSMQNDIVEHVDISHKKVLIVIARMKNKEESADIANFAAKMHYPLLADIQSSQAGNLTNLCAYDLLITQKSWATLLQEADIVIQFGEQLLSTNLTQFIASFSGQYWLVADSMHRIDALHRVNFRFNCSPIQWLKKYRPITRTLDADWLMRIKDQHKRLNKHILQPFVKNLDLSEIGVVAALDKLLIENSPLFIGNSMPIRLADMFMPTQRCQIYSNRGASGIDGLIASAIGVAKHKKTTSTLLIGDTSFLYDLNSLALLKQLSTAFIIIVLNNDGGSIFNLLPVPTRKKETFINYHMG